MRPWNCTSEHPSQRNKNVCSHTKITQMFVVVLFTIASPENDSDVFQWGWLNKPIPTHHGVPLNGWKAGTVDTHNRMNKAPGNPGELKMPIPEVYILCNSFTWSSQSDKIIKNKEQITSCWRLRWGGGGREVWLQESSIAGPVPMKVCYVMATSLSIYRFWYHISISQDTSIGENW